MTPTVAAPGRDLPPVPALHAAGSLLVALLGAMLLPGSTALPWLAVAALVAGVTWLRRRAPLPPATEVRLALAWGLLWAAFGMAAAGTAAGASALAVLAPVLVAGGLLLWRRPRLLALHLALAAAPGVAAATLAGALLAAAATAVTAVLVWLAAQHARHRPTAAARLPLGSPVVAARETDPPDALLEATTEACFVVDGAGRIEVLNSAARALTGASVGDRFRDAVPLLEPDTRSRARDPVAECLRRDAVVRIEDGLAVVTAPARECSVSLRAVPLARQRALVSLRDRTELRTLERLQALQAGRDPLTGLPNRHELERRYRRLQARASGETHALCCLEVEQVALVNEVCGYAAGDALLRHVALQLAGSARGEDCLARLHGGQFALLLAACDADMARTVAGKLLERLSRSGFAWGGQRFNLSGRVGIAPIAGDGAALAEVMGAAASACRVAAENDREAVHVHDDADAALQRHAELREWMQRVQRAVEGGRFELMVHDIAPLRAAADGQQRNAELLVRMRDDDGTLVAPGLFLGAAERLQLMPAIDRWVVREALSLMADADGPLAGYGFCAINLSGQSLSQPDMCEYLEQQLDESGVAPSRVCFEITETAVIADLPVAAGLMHRLRERGCRFALDDFGTGLSSYAYLKQLPADLLKIDGAFVRGMIADPTDRAVVESINQVAHMVGMRTIAEYVQDTATLAALERLGVDFGQGSLYGEPRPLD